MDVDELLDIDLTGIHEDLEAFHEDKMVQEALQRGVDLKKYADELDNQLKEAEAETVINANPNLRPNAYPSANPSANANPNASGKAVCCQHGRRIWLTQTNARLRQVHANPNPYPNTGPDPYPNPYPYAACSLVCMRCCSDFRLTWEASVRRSSIYR